MGSSDNQLKYKYMMSLACILSWHGNHVDQNMKISFNLNSPCLEEVMRIKQSNQPGHKLHTIWNKWLWHVEIRFLDFTYILTDFMWHVPQLLFLDQNRESDKSRSKQSDLVILQGQHLFVWTQTIQQAAWMPIYKLTLIFNGCVYCLLSSQVDVVQFP